MEAMNLESYNAEILKTPVWMLDLEKLSRIECGQARHAVSGSTNEIIADQQVPLNFDEQEKIEADLLGGVFGLGPLEPLLHDSEISDVLVNGEELAFIEKVGLLQKVNTAFRHDRHLLRIIDRMVSLVAHRFVARADDPRYDEIRHRAGRGAAKEEGLQLVRLIAGQMNLLEDGETWN